MSTPVDSVSARTVSIVVPCRNEAGFIGPFLDSALAQRLPQGWSLQIIIADGQSDDGTAAILAARAEAEPKLVCIDNPARIVSTGLNRAVAAATGEVVVRMDVHTTYADDYVAECLAALERTGATCVGGAWRPRGGRGVSGWIARAFESRFGSGGAASRRVDLEAAVDTVYLGAWRRDDLQRLGGFDEALVRNQDDELALRIVRGGGTVWQSARIRSAYVPRASYRALWRQFWQYGYWKVAVIRKHRLPAAPRQLVPFAFVASLAGLALAGLAWRPAWAALTVLAVAYGLASLAAAAGVARPWREPAACLGIAAATATMHLGYGLGFARGLWDFVVRRRGATVAATRLTR